MPIKLLKVRIQGSQPNVKLTEQLESIQRLNTSDLDLDLLFLKEF